MIRTLLPSFALLLGATFFCAGANAANPVDATGRWNVTASGDTLTSGQVKIEQAGSNIVATYGQSGRIDGAFKAGTLQVDGTWNDSRGTGWLTIIFTADGNDFSGEWGFEGRKPSGHFVAKRLTPTYPNVTGLYNANVSGGAELSARKIKLHQLEQTVVGNYGPGTQLGGTMVATDNTMNGTWSGPNGSGWIKLQFTPDSRGFSGDWGLGSDTQARGHIVGTIVNTAQLYVHGLWDTASSSVDLSVGTLKLQQQGQTVTGTYKDGHLQGTLPRGSSAMTGRWRDTRGTGDFVLKFSPDGNTFEGTWTSHKKTTGRIVGKHIIAASPSLHQ